MKLVKISCESAAAGSGRAVFRRPFFPTRPGSDCL